MAIQILNFIFGLILGYSYSMVSILPAYILNFQKVKKIQNDLKHKVNDLSILLFALIPASFVYFFPESLKASFIIAAFFAIFFVSLISLVWIVLMLLENKVKSNFDIDDPIQNHWPSLKGIMFSALISTLIANILMLYIQYPISIELFNLFGIKPEY